MDGHSKDADRKLLQNRTAIWTKDPELNLTEDEIDSLMELFSGPGEVAVSWVRAALARQFLYFMTKFKDEKFREVDGGLKKASKPSTIAKRETKKLREACEAVEKLLASPDQATTTWIDQHLKETGVRDENGRRVRLQNLREALLWPIDQLISAARSADEISSPGPNNVALKEMAYQLAFIWEEFYGAAAVSDGARNQTDDPFLELCQTMAKMADARFQLKDGRVDYLQLTGIVPEVLESRKSERGELQRRSNFNLRA